MNRNANIDGIGSITGGEYDVITIDGIGKVKGNVTCSRLVVDGMLKGKGRINAGSFECDGMSRNFRDIKAKTVKINGLLKLRRAKLESDTINCDGIIVCNREISADEIYIDGVCSVARMYGDKITIKNRINGITESKIPYKILPFVRAYLGREINLSYSIVDVIECTELFAENLKAKSIKAHNVTLGENCEVDKIECSGELKYSNSCNIGKKSAGKASKLDEGVENMANVTLVKILDMYKKGTINADEAEKMITSVMGKGHDDASAKAGLPSKS